MGLNRLNCVFMLVFMINRPQNAAGDDNTSLDDIINRRTKEYFELCPYTDTCYTNVSKPDEVMYGMSQPCCNPCICDSECGLNCCPDVSVNVESKEDIYEATEIHRCVDAQYRPYDTRTANGQSFEMISKCPLRYQDNEIAAQCAREYHDVSFEVPLRYIVPVHDKSTDSLYKNIFCAKCHNASLDSLGFGRVSFNCEIIMRNITYIRDLTVAPEFKDEDGCNILFEIPENTDGISWALKTCDRTFIDRCNMTGQWKSYNIHLEQACLSYMSVYNNYRNVHCLLCNGLNKSEVSRTCPYYTSGIYYDYTENIKFNFITLLNWNKAEENVLLGTTKQQTSLTEQCFENSLLDPSERGNWFLQCPYGMVMNTRMCLPPFINMSTDIMVEINLILEPYGVVQKQGKLTLNEMISTLLDAIELKMSLLITGNIELHNVIGSLKFKTDIGRINPQSKDIALGSMQYVKVQIQILVNNAEQDLLGTVLDFALGFTNLSSIGNFFQASFHHFDTFFIDQWSLKFKCIKAPNRPLFQLCIETQMSRDRELHFQVLHKQEIIYVHESYTVVSLEPEPFCPRIALPKLTFIKCNQSEHIAELYTNSFLSKRLTGNETHMFFCHEDYFQHLDSLQTNHVTVQKNEVPQENVHTVTYLTIVCLCISLMSLVLTLAVYSVYPALRSLPGLNNMALVTSLILFQTISLVITVSNITISWLCSLFGAITHFSLILSFAWMFVCTFHMLKVFIKIRNRSVGRNDSRTFVSYVIFTTGISLLAVSITMSTAAVQSGGTNIGYGGYSCYIKDAVMVIFLVALPVAIVIIVNIFMFCVVVFKIHKHPTLASSNAKERHNITIFVKLSTITGMTWIFGFIYIFTQFETFAYIFVILNAGQGVFIMLSFVCNRRVINMICKQRLGRHTTMQTTMQTTNTEL